MNPATPSPNNHPNGWLNLLEKVTSTILVMVLLGLGWMVVVAWQPDVARLGSVELEAIIVIILLTGALATVSVLALLQTRSD